MNTTNKAFQEDHAYLMINSSCEKCPPYFIKSYCDPVTDKELAFAYMEEEIAQDLHFNCIQEQEDKLLSLTLAQDQAMYDQSLHINFNRVPERWERCLRGIENALINK